MSIKLQKDKNLGITLHKTQPDETIQSLMEPSTTGEEAKSKPLDIFKGPITRLTSKSRTLTFLCASAGLIGVITYLTLWIIGIPHFLAPVQEAVHTLKPILSYHQSGSTGILQIMAIAMFIFGTGVSIAKNSAIPLVASLGILASIWFMPTFFESMGVGLMGAQSAYGAGTSSVYKSFHNLEAIMFGSKGQEVYRVLPFTKKEILSVYPKVLAGALEEDARKLTPKELGAGWYLVYRQLNPAKSNISAAQKAALISEISSVEKPGYPWWHPNIQKQQAEIRQAEQFQEKGDEFAGGMLVLSVILGGIALRQKVRADKLLNVIGGKSEGPNALEASPAE